MYTCMLGQIGINRSIVELEYGRGDIQLPILSYTRSLVIWFRDFLVFCSTFFFLVCYKYIGILLFIYLNICYIIYICPSRYCRHGTLWRIYSWTIFFFFYLKIDIPQLWFLSQSYYLNYAAETKNDNESI